MRQASVIISIERWGKEDTEVCFFYAKWGQVFCGVFEIKLEDREAKREKAGRICNWGA